MSSPLAGKVAVVTGGASGIGRASASRLAQDGARVVVADRDGEAADRAAEEIAAEGGRAVSCRADVSNEADIVSMVQVAVERFGRIDVLHNNAALTDSLTSAPDVGIESADAATWLAIYQVNTVGTMLACKHAIPVMRRGGGGSIVNTSSAAGLAASGVSPSYGASKAALNLLTKHVATTYGRDGVRCNAVAPGVVLTDNVRSRLTAEDIELYVSRASLPRAAEPSQLASVVAFLAGDDAALITGQIISVDGGLLNALPYARDLLRPSSYDEDG